MAEEFFRLFGQTGSANIGCIGGFWQRGQAEKEPAKRRARVPGQVYYITISRAPANFPAEAP